MARIEARYKLRLVLLLTFLMLVLATYQFTIEALNLGVLFRSQKWTSAAGMGICGVVLVFVLLIMSWTSLNTQITGWLNQAVQTFARLKEVNLLLLILVIAAYSFLIIGPIGLYFQTVQLRLPLFWITTISGAFFLRAFSLSTDDHGKVWGARGWLGITAVAWILGGFGYKIASFIPDVSTYPFSIGWSEASRYYYASLFFSKQIYGVGVAPSPLHPSRYLLQAIPFIIPSLPLWVHRLWQVLLWIGITYITVYLLAKRFGHREGWTWISRLAFTSWGFLFLLQGPVYYHLLICALIVLWGYDSHHLWKSLGVVLLASAWAGISRINWYPVPGMLAACIYFLENDIEGSEIAEGKSNRFIQWKDWSKYLLLPILWVGLGTLIAFASQEVYIFLTGTEVLSFTSSFSSDLLWYRLWPNPTFPLGILPAILLVSIPTFVISLRGLRKIHWLRQLGLWTILFILFLGGVVVSTKIGGGSNLHNLDAFLMVLMVVGSYVLFENVKYESTVEGAGNRKKVSSSILALALLVPVVIAISSGNPLVLPARENIQEVLTSLNSLVTQTMDQGGEVLFISQRHLLTFGMIPNVPLVGNYEKVFLMEMAMAGNTAYLTNFYDDIREQRFGMIVSDPVRETLKGSDEMFGEENDVWVNRVTKPLLTYYQEADLFKQFGIEVLVPK